MMKNYILRTIQFHLKATAFTAILSFGTLNALAQVAVDRPEPPEKPSITGTVQVVLYEILCTCECYDVLTDTTWPFQVISQELPELRSVEIPSLGNSCEKYNGLFDSLECLGGTQNCS